MNWREFPFLKILPAYLLGILLAERGLVPGLSLEACWGVLAAAVFCACWTGFQALAYRQWRLFSFWCWACFLVLGLWRHLDSDPLRDPRHIAHREDETLYALVLAEEVRPGRKSLKVIARVHSAGVALDAQEPVSGRVLLYLKPTDSVFVHGGNMLAIRGKPEHIADNPNPDAFNYAAYLRKKGIYQQWYAGEGAWMVYEKWGGAWWQKRLYACRAYCTGLLAKALPDKQAYAIGAALIIGNRERMDPEVRDVFSRAGAMHVLAVSGLHVGMVAWCLGWMLQKIPLPGIWGRWVRGVLQVGGIWGYALLCGAGASVTRAALMFSWLMLGKTLDRPANIWNTLSGAALLLLLLEPRWISDIGFQLSFLAVAGIVLLEPVIYRILVFRWKPADYLWKLTAVGFAAQTATGPLSIFYFHQFPLFFWLSGWIAVPLGALCQGLGIGYMLLGKVPVVGEGLACVLHWSVQGLLASMQWIDRIPHTSLQGLWLSEWGVWCAYGLLMLAVCAIFMRNKAFVWSGAGLLLLGGLLEFRRDIQAEQRSEVICYGIQGATAIEFWQGRQAYVLYAGDEARIAGEVKVYHARQNLRELVRLDAADTSFFQVGALMRSGPLLSAGGVRFFIWDGAADKHLLPPPDADYWILCNSPFLPRDALEQRLPQKGVLIDGSHTAKSLRFYKRYFEEKGIPVWFTLEQGAWRQTFKPHRYEKKLDKFRILFAWRAP